SLEFRFSRGRAEPEGGDDASRNIKYRTEDRFDRLDLSRHSGGDDNPKPLFLRQRLLHGLGKQQSRKRHSKSALQQSHAAFDGFFQSNAKRLSDVAHFK